jgi:RimJ/RimL family protein N-acetyltransferase
VSFIETQRLLLRTWMPNDAEPWFAIASEPELNEYLPVSHPPTPETVRMWIEAQMEEQDREHFSSWPVVRKDDGVLIGRCGLHRLPDGDVEIAWAFDRAVWGMGYAHEAATAVLAFAREQLRLPRVVALVDPRNAPSIALVNRLGMRYERLVRAYRRDLLRYRAYGQEKAS